MRQALSWTYNQFLLHRRWSAGLGVVIYRVEEMVAEYEINLDDAIAAKLVYYRSISTGQGKTS